VTRRQDTKIGTLAPGFRSRPSAGAKALLCASRRSRQGKCHHRVVNVAETVDDVIGPMVNRDVIVRVRRGKRGLTFIDIEPDE
jgi:hypothetical protein